MSDYKGSGAITREQFLFYETRIVARLLSDENLSDEEIISRIIEENLFQFPTEKSLKRTVTGCLRRLRCLEDEQLIRAIAHSPMEVGKQVCLYAMMKQYRLVWDFMITVIGAKFREQDLSYSRMDLNVFFMRLQEQDDEVASWSDATINKIKQVFNKILIENEYIDGPRATKLNPVMICSEVDNAIRADGNDVALPAFNCFY
ncbi:MAG: DUF1819 family protein [Lachnospiraceae bacterium]